MGKNTINRDTEGRFDVFDELLNTPLVAGSARNEDLVPGSK